MKKASAILHFSQVVWNGHRIVCIYKAITLCAMKTNMYSFDMYLQYNRRYVLDSGDNIATTNHTTGYWQNKNSQIGKSNK